jgi:hypothetical protein
MPPDFQVDYYWDSGVSNIGPDYLSCHVLLLATDAGTINCTMGHPSSSQQQDWVETFDVTADDLQVLYTRMHEAGLFTRTWQQADPIPGVSGGPGVRVVAGASDYRVPSALADPRDTDSIAIVYEEIRRMVPETIWQDLEARQARYIEEHDS